MKNTVQEQLSELNQLDQKQGELYHRFAVHIGISDTAFWVLYSLCESDTVFTQNTLAELWCFPKQTINSAINNLVNTGYLELRQLPKARNSKTIHLTEKGTDFCNREIMPLFQAEQKAFSRLSLTERDTTLYLAKKHYSFLQEELSRLAETAETEDL